MNGLTGSDVDFVLEKLKVAIGKARYDCETTSVMGLEDIASTIKRLRQESTTQASRPDRVGDECWFRTGGDWQRGIVRYWIPRDGAVIECVETKRIFYAWEIYFTAEAPQ